MDAGVLSRKTGPLLSPAPIAIILVETLMNLRSILASVIVGIASVSAHADDPSFSISGKWNTDFGLAELTESDGNVTGTYPFENGKIIGTRTGNRLTAQWTQNTSTRKCDNAVNGSYYHGQIIFDFTANEFTGKWGRCDETPADNWSGKRDLGNTAESQSQESQAAANAGLSPAPCPECPAWVSRSFESNYLPLAAQAETWSDPKLFVLESGQMTVQSRFMGQHGTTCKFEVQFNNAGANAMDERIIVARPGKSAVGNNDFTLRAQLAPGTSVAYGTEVRECPLKMGKSQDMTKCASCEPVVYFVAD